MLQLEQIMEGKREGRLYIGKHNLKMESYLSCAVLSNYNEGKGREGEGRQTIIL